jgi:hypothetical protein
MVVQGPKIRTDCSVASRLGRLGLLEWIGILCGVSPDRALVNSRESPVEYVFGIIVWIIVGAAAIVVIFSFVSVARSSKTADVWLANHAEARERAEKLLALHAETNQLLRDLIAAVRDKK